MTYILNPDKYIRPNILLCPFKLSDNPELESVTDEEIFKDFDEEFILTKDGREAINLALLDILPQYSIKNLKVLIVTSSNSDYVSSCVTSSIEKYGEWTTKDTGDYNVIFLIHEFGATASLPDNVKLNVPIIEDFAPSLFLYGSTGVDSNYQIFSFTKFFPVQEGGLLIGLSYGKKDSLKLSNYTLNVLRKEWPKRENIRIVRKSVEAKLIEGFVRMGFSPFYSDYLMMTPWALMISNERKISNLGNLKEYFDAHGILIGVFHGHDAFYIPCHQNLGNIEIDYILRVFQNFIENA